MDARLQSVAMLLALNTRLLHNCLDRVDDELGNRRLTPDSNSLAFLAAHLTDSRHYLCRKAGREIPNPIGAVLKRGRSLDEIGTLPPLATIRAEWDTVSDHLLQMLEELDGAMLAEPGFKFPGTDGTLFGMISFLAQHDSYHIGQMSLLRRQLGLSAMRYQ
jgi:uncharacterized damage-inducible protein DinB